MKILFLLTQDLQSPGGLGRYFPMARALAELGHQVSISALHADFSHLSEQQFIQNGVKVNYVAQMHVSKSGNYKFYFNTLQLVSIVANATIKLTRSALDTPADIIHIGKPHPMNGIAGLVAGKLLERKLFVDCDDYEAGSGRFPSAWQRLIVSNFEKRLPLSASMVTTNTQFMRNKLTSWGVPSANILDLPNGIDRLRFAKPDPDEVESLRTELGLEGKKVVAFIGSLSLTSHPINLLIDAFAQIKSTTPSAHLLIVGGGDSLSELQAQVQQLALNKHVTFTGRIPPDRLVLYYHLCHVTVDPVYYNEAALGRLPMKLFESWACGVPFVTADVGDRRRYLENPLAGLLVQPGDPAALAEAILRIFSDPGLGESISRNGTLLVEDYYWDRLVRRLETQYKRVLGIMD